MEVNRKIAIAVSCAAFVLTACSGGGMSEAEQSARDACNGAFVFDQVVQRSKAGETFVPERVQQGIADMYSAADRAQQQDDKYMQLSIQVGQFEYSMDHNDPSVVLDLVAIEGECEQLGFGVG